MSPIGHTRFHEVAVGTPTAVVIKKQMTNSCYFIKNKSIFIYIYFLLSTQT